MDLNAALRHIPDFPKAGIDFIDITTVLKDKNLLVRRSRRWLSWFEMLISIIIGSESRGFILGAPMAYASGRASTVRKKGMLPYRTVSATYSLEFGLVTHLKCT
jgi:adenine phosphoribosyltransferase